MNITIIQNKAFLLLVEVSENIYKLFLVIVTIIYNIKIKIEDTAESIISYLLYINKNNFIINNLHLKYSYIIHKNNFQIYSNLLSPPRK
ncbi:MAG: hypothetical protein QM532_03405 [Cyanobium sp. MAG06]|nr:hypothetical protein [Cyanobium sp. MAG06]